MEKLLTLISKYEAQLKLLESLAAQGITLKSGDIHDDIAFNKRLIKALKTPAIIQIIVGSTNKLENRESA